jgi:hypothetical protein
MASCESIGLWAAGGRVSTAAARSWPFRRRPGLRGGPTVRFFRHPGIYRSDRGINHPWSAAVGRLPLVGPEPSGSRGTSLLFRPLIAGGAWNRVVKNNRGRPHKRFTGISEARRFDVSFHLFTPGACPAFRSGRCQGPRTRRKEHALPIVRDEFRLAIPRRVARQHCSSPLHQHEQDITASRNAGAKEDISTLPGRGHFYFALTRTSSARDIGCRM